MGRKEPWGAISVPMEAHFTYRGQPPRECTGLDCGSTGKENKEYNHRSVERTFVVVVGCACTRAYTWPWVINAYWTKFNFVFLCFPADHTDCKISWKAHKKLRIINSQAWAAPAAISMPPHPPLAPLPPSSLPCGTIFTDQVTNAAQSNINKGHLATTSSRYPGNRIRHPSCAGATPVVGAISYTRVWTHQEQLLYVGQIFYYKREWRRFARPLLFGNRHLIPTRWNGNIRISSSSKFGVSFKKT